MLECEEKFSSFLKNFKFHLRAAFPKSANVNSSALIPSKTLPAFRDISEAGEWRKYDNVHDCMEILTTTCVTREKRRVNPSNLCQFWQNFKFWGNVSEDNSIQLRRRYSVVFWVHIFIQNVSILRAEVRNRRSLIKRDLQSKSYFFYQSQKGSTFIVISERFRVYKLTFIFVESIIQYKMNLNIFIAVDWCPWCSGPTTTAQ